jgi:hypothetical protein
LLKKASLARNIERNIATHTILKNMAAGLPPLQAIQPARNTDISVARNEYACSQVKI